MFEFILIFHVHVHVQAHVHVHLLDMGGDMNMDVQRLESLTSNISLRNPISDVSVSVPYHSSGILDRVSTHDRMFQEVCFTY
jgi:hypothetical protein